MNREPNADYDADRDFARDYLDMMRATRREISSLRERIAYLEPQAEAYRTLRDMVATITGQRAQSFVAVPSDVLPSLDREMERVATVLLARERAREEAAREAAIQRAVVAPARDTGFDPEGG